jgi:F-type H+-transporting ATPase subunit c
MTDLHLFAIVSTVVAALAIALGVFFPALAMGRAISSAWTRWPASPRPRRRSAAPCSSAWP